MISAYDGIFGYTAHSSDLLSQVYLTTPPRTPSPTSVASNIGPLSLSLDLETLSTRYKEGNLEPAALVDTIFERIKSHELIDPAVWICLRDKLDVLKDANELAEKWTGHPLPPLYGIPFAIKDNIDVAAMTTTAGCPKYAYRADETSPVVSALLSAGAILIGKTNMDQLATGLSGCRSPYGSPCSVYGDGSYIPGGSSSGSGVSVAAGLVTFALGTDTAGSGRVPAAFNGIVGYKPTKGTLSARGVVPACKSLDTLSVFAQCASDARSVWQVVDNYDKNDPYAKIPGSLPLIASEYKGLKNAGFTFACPPPCALEVCSKQYQAMFASSVKALGAIGGRMRTLSNEEYKPFRDASELLYSGALVNERISCIGYEFIASHLDSLHPTTRALFTAVLERESKPWKVFDDQIKQMEYTRQVQGLFAENFDVLMLPTVPFHPTLEAMEADPIGLNARIGEFTHFANVVDLCAISLNAGFWQGPHGRMPFGISLVCASGLDGKMFDIAALAEAAFTQSLEC
jgi:allophanate hydrolase